MRKYKNSFPKNPASFETQESDIGMLSIEGDEGDQGGGGGGGDNEPKPFSVSESDWQTTQQELQTLRQERERFGTVERELGEIKTRFAPFLGKGGNEGSEDREPNPDSYPKTQEGARKYLRDLNAYDFKQLSAQQQASAREQQEGAAETQRTNSLITEHVKRTTELSKTVPDFDRVVQGGLITMEQHRPLALAILKLKNSAMVEYHLAKNPQEAMQLIRTASVDLDDAKEVLFGLNHKYSEESRKSAARKAAERGGFEPTHTVENELAASGDDAADEDYVRGRMGLGSKK